MSEFVVEKNLPMVRFSKFPQLEVGDSFLIPLSQGRLDEQTRSSAFGEYSKRKQKIVTRKTNDGIRVWRIA